MILRPTLGLLAVSALSLSCHDATDAANVTNGAPTTPVTASESVTEEPPAPPTRYEFLGGSFVTYNRELAPEVIEAASGQVPARPVFVWAGNESADSPKQEAASGFEPRER
jgi:hypothetical protein